MKLIYKLISGFLVIASLIWLVGYLSINFSRESLRKSIEESSLIIAQETLDKINRNIFSRIEEMQVYSTDTVLQRLVLLSNQRFDAMENAHAFIDKQDKEWRATSSETITPFMRELIDNELFQELKEKADFYKEKYGYEIFGEIYVTNKYGVVAGQTVKTDGYYYGNDEWWHKGKQKGFHIEDVAFDKNTGIYSIDIVVRIDDDMGNFLGIIKAVLNIDEAINIIKEIQYRKEAKNDEINSIPFSHMHHKRMEMELISREGRIIYSSEDEEKFTDISGAKFFKKITDDSIIGSFIMHRDQPGKADELYTHYHSEGYKDFDGQGWIFLMEHDTEEIFAPVEALKRYILIISFVITVLAIFIGCIISASIARSVKKLSKVAKAVGRGDLEQRVIVNSTDEIGQLGLVFNNMIEKRRQSLEELKRHREQLAELVDERTRELRDANENLTREIIDRKRAETEAVRASQLASIGELAAGVAHEINNPINGIINYAQMLSDSLNRETRDHDISQRIVKEGNRIASIVKSLLSFSRMREDDKRHVLFKDLLDDVMNLTLKQLQKDNINISISGLADTKGLWCNQQQIQQVILNVISNARYALNVKYSNNSKGKEFKITADEIDIDGRPHIQLCFRDSGCGISEENIKKIFNPFFSTKSRKEGTGIGLAISYNIIRQHEGTIEVESADGEFTEITINLPMEKKK